jgi:ribosomal protein L11 methyltransferase
VTDQWFAIEVTADPGAVEAIESVFNEFDALGTEVQQFHKRENDPLTVIGYFNELPDASWFDEALSNGFLVYDLNPESIKSIERKTVERTDWLAEWKKHWRPTSVGRYLIVPNWIDVSGVAADQMIIRIDPNMAFGTGTHETTQLCLKAIDQRLRPDDSFLDVGTGTGILAIAAAKLADNKQHILAIDNDPLAIEIARKNAARNGVADLVEFKRGALSDWTPQFDFVCANLTLDVIRPILPMLVQKTRRILVLSGILKEQESNLADDLARLGITNSMIETAGEWVSATVEV